MAYFLLIIPTMSIIPLKGLSYEKHGWSKLDQAFSLPKMRVLQGNFEHFIQAPSFYFSNTSQDKWMFLMKNWYVTKNPQETGLNIILAVVCRNCINPKQGSYIN